MEPSHDNCCGGDGDRKGFDRSVEARRDPAEPALNDIALANRATKRLVVHPAMPSRLREAVAAFQRGKINQARELAEAELYAQPGSPRLMHLMGLIECRSGRLRGGVEWLSRASAAEPANVAYRVMLVRALVDSGRAAEGLEIAQPPSGTSSAELALWHARAEAAVAAEAWPEAADAWGKMCLVQPDDWRAWGNLGEALARLEKWPDAATALRKASDLNPSERSLQEKFAAALGWAGQYEESAKQFQEMLHARPQDVEARLTLARLHADLGRNEDAMEQLEKAAQFAVGESGSAQRNTDLIRIALPDYDPSRGLSDADHQAVRELALLLERTNRMEALRNLLSDAKKMKIPPERLAYPAAAVALRDGKPAEAKGLLELERADSDPVRSHRLMAKIGDTLADYEGAFGAADVMNRSVVDFDTWVQRGASYRKRLRGYEQSITREWAARLRRLDRGARRSPAFLVGFPRSGTTLLDTFLMGHPDVEVLEEFHMLGAAETVLGNVADLPNRSPEELEQARQAYFAELDRHTDPSFGGLIVDKLPLNMLGLPVIHSLFPEARIIFAQRHPCDVVLSGFMQSFTLNDAMACFLTLEGAADLYDVVMGVFSRARHMLPIVTHTLVYEELVAEPEAALRPLIDFLGLEWHCELLDHRSTAGSRGAIITPSYDQVVQPLSRRPSGRWRRYEKQLAPVLPVLLSWAERLGYRD